MEIHLGYSKRHVYSDKKLVRLWKNVWMFSESVLAYLYPINIWMLQQGRGLILLICIQTHSEEQTAPQRPYSQGNEW